MTREAIAELWGSITCPTLLVYGTESWATNPAEDGRLAYFKNASVLGVEKAGHWVHHDQLDLFLREVRAFLGPNRP
jgi:pimeloyl-ACP methyl ester carboxylesterase